MFWGIHGYIEAFQNGANCQDLRDSVDVPDCT
jgi:hypothetical protein